MECAWVYKVSRCELIDIAKALELLGVHEMPFEAGYLDVSVQRISDHVDEHEQILGFIPGQRITWARWPVARCRWCDDRCFAITPCDAGRVFNICPFSCTRWLFIRCGRRTSLMRREPQAISRQQGLDINARRPELFQVLWRRPLLSGLPSSQRRNMDAYRAGHFVEGPITCMLPEASQGCRQLFSSICHFGASVRPPLRREDRQWTPPIQYLHSKSLPGAGQPASARATARRSGCTAGRAGRCSPPWGGSAGCRPAAR